MKLYIAQALIEDEQLCYIDDPDAPEVESFLGAHSTVEKAQAFLEKVANLERQAENDLIDECETGEAHLPELRLTWAHKPKDPALAYTRDTWTSGAVEFANRGLKVRYQVFQSALNPVL